MASRSSASMRRGSGRPRRCNSRKEGEDGAVAALVTLVMGLRAGEVVSRIVRDLDDDGTAALDPGLEDRGGEANAAGAGVPPDLPAGARGGEAVRGSALRVSRPELATEMGGEDLQGGGGAEGDGSRHAWLARHARSGDGAQRARGGGGSGTRVGDDDAPELREGGGGSAGAGSGCSTCSRAARKTGLLNAKRLLFKRFADALRRKNPE